ncbi:unnamed protein product [Caenorhabditis sp. 36 PRJEB53466]|nr:unnamed protein product [Caenorhabditis sp. 36 PRJEB53466]
MLMNSEDESSDENEASKPQYQRGVPQNQSSFPRGRSNFSSGTVPNRRVESTPVNTLATGHSNKMLMTTYRISRPRGPSSENGENDQGSAEQISDGASTSRHDHLNNYSYPIDRSYLQDVNIFPLKPSIKQDASNVKRYSLPSTHILYEKTRHKGGVNIEEQEKVAKMLQAAVEDTIVEQPAPVVPQKDNLQLTVDVKLFGAMNNETFGYYRTHMGTMKQFFGKCLKKSDAVEVNWLKTGLMPRATYEEQVYMIETNILIRPIELFSYPHELFTQFVTKFTRQTVGMLHDQVFVEPTKMHTLFPKITPQHIDVSVSGIAIGNCPNPGLFLVRGDYISQENTVCSVKLQAQHTVDPTREHTAYKVAGNNRYLSYARFEHDKRVLVVCFGVRLRDFGDDGLDHAGFRLNMYYNSFTRVIVDLSKENMNSIYIQLKNPPLLWEGIPKSTVYNPSKSKVLNMEMCTEWMRVLSWPGDAEQRGIGCTTEAFAQSRWVRITFRKDDVETDMSSSYLLEIISRIASRCNVKVSFGSVFSIRRKLAPSPAFQSLGTFRANYALQALITRGSVFLDQLLDVTDVHVPEDQEKPMVLEHEPLFLKIVRRCMKECTQATEETLEQLLNAIDERRNVIIVQAFQSLYKSRKVQYERLLSGESIQDSGLAKPLPKNCVSVAKVIVTPSRVLLMAPEVMMVNRVVRRFGPDYALRCVFRDDNMGRLAIRDFSINNIDHMSNIVTQGIYHTLRNGIQVADRLYSFLGWSNSQMRDQGCYLYAPHVDQVTGMLTGTVEDIRAWMGDFRDAVSVPKMMSRMGQCFTQAQPTVRLKRKHWIVEADIEGGLDNKYCFSDGCGRISCKLAAQITKLLELKEVPACFQVRFKGFKGIVVIDPTIDEIINMPKIIFRKSQRKFGEGSGDLQDDYLEVVKYAMPSPVCFNRPFITILDQVSAKQSARSHARITNRVHYYLERELCLLSNMMINESQAAEELFNRTNLPIDWLKVSKRAGFQLTVDPFVRAMIFSIYRYNIIHHISKAKIFLPPNMGRSMYGVVDETGLLQHGQVFIQYSPSIRQTSRQPVLKTGKVLITKNPCHVPGDVRVFEAVWQPALVHLVDVVVFPQHGPRPHPDEMAGSDLDGDEYLIIWDQEMLLDYNEDAMVFPSSSALEEEKEPTVDDMVEFFLRYLQQDSIGRMSHAHLAYADLHGLFHENCHSIALKCAVAVDFPKSGVPAEPLAIYEQCEVTPDYMMSGGKPMYYSTRLNGQLYRRARKVEEVLEEYENRDSLFAGEYDKLICPDDEDVFFGDQVKLFNIVAIRDEYASKMQQLLDEYGIEDEASVVSGHAASIKRLAGMERDDYSFYHTDKVVELRYEKLFKIYRAMFFEEYGGEEANSTSDGRNSHVVSTQAMQEKVRQWYFVAYVQPRKNKAGRSIGQSLPWVAWDVLCDLRRKLMLDKAELGPQVRYPMSVRLAEEMELSIERQSEQFETFKCLVNTCRDGLCIERYSQVYGDKITKMVFLLKVWLEKENVLPSEVFNIWHVGRLLIRFALGVLRGNPLIDYEKSILKTEAVLHQWISRKEEQLETNDCQIDMGSLMIEFLRYLASQSFALSEKISLRVFSDKGIIEPVLLHNSQWMALHHVAYRTFHALSVSGRFDALHLDDDGVIEYISESKNPILVNESVFNCKNYTEDNPVARGLIMQSLKEWSGVTEIISRDYTGRAKNDLVYVTSVGTVLAKQRLARLLLLSGETIRDAIANDTVPAEVRDEFL